MKRATDITGQRFNRLTVLGFSHHDAGKRGHWLCRCDCGAETRVQGWSLANGRTKSCGCIVPATSAAVNRTHGQSPVGNWSGAYRAWMGMMQRVRGDKDKHRRDYVERGIGVCEQWRSFENFYADMGDRPEGMTLGREDNDKGYSFDNCRWETPKQQARNTRRNIMIEWRGKRQALSAWAEELGLPYSALITRYRAEWPAERMFSQPIRVTRRHAA